MKTKKTERKLCKRGAYALGVVLDVDFRTDHNCNPVTAFWSTDIHGIHVSCALKFRRLVR